MRDRYDRREFQHFGNTEDYSYLEDGDVYEEYLEPVDEIEVSDDEEVEIIELVPPPPFPPHFDGAYPPPPFGNFPPFPPHFIPPNGNFYPEEIEFDDGEVFEYEPEHASTKSSSSKVQKSSRAQSSAESKPKLVRSYSSIVASNVNSIEGKGAAQAERMKNDENFSKIKFVFKFIFGIACFAALVLLCCAFIFWNYSKISEVTGQIDSQTTTSNVNWRLPDSISNNIIREFFESLGEMSVVADYRDMLVKGTIELNGKTEQFYCIRRADGNSYVKIGTVGKDERAYYVSGDSSAVYRLFDMRANGDRNLVPDKEALFLRGLANFDEHLYIRAFGNDVRVMASSTESFSFIGKTKLEDGELAGELQSEACGAKYRYYFSTQTGVLLETFMEMSGYSLRVTYSNYEELNSGVKYPFVKKLYLNGKLTATVNVSVASRNKGFIIP